MRACVCSFINPIAARPAENDNASERCCCSRLALSLSLSLENRPRKIIARYPGVLCGERTRVVLSKIPYDSVRASTNRQTLRERDREGERVPGNTKHTHTQQRTRTRTSCTPRAHTHSLSMNIVAATTGSTRKTRKLDSCCAAVVVGNLFGAVRE